MLRSSLMGLDRRQLRRWLGLFFLALAIPTAVLIFQAYDQLKWEAFHRHRVLAEELASRVDATAARFIADEERRSFAEYGFLVVSGDPSASFIQRSALSAYPVRALLPGLIGYFQVDTEGVFSSPLLPADGGNANEYGVNATEQSERVALQNKIRDILGRNRLVETSTVVTSDTSEVLRDADKDQKTEAVAGYHSNSSAETESDHSSIPANVAKYIQEVVPEAMQEAFQSGVSDHSTLPASAMDMLAGKAPKPTSETIKLSAVTPNQQVSSSQAAFDELALATGVRAKKKVATPSLGRVEDLRLDSPYADSAARLKESIGPAREVQLEENRQTRKERSAIAEMERQVLEKNIVAELKQAAFGELRITTFESELDPFEFRLLDSGEFVMFRKVWRESRRYIQGALLNRDEFLTGMTGEAFEDTALSRMSSLAVAYQGDVLALFRSDQGNRYLTNAAELDGALLYRSRLSAPLSELELIFNVTRLPAGPGASVLVWVAAILSLVLCGGFFLMYRLGARQIDLTRQQQDFVSAVSHELKTPLTSIRMYGEMLREGWASEEKKKVYYDHIFHESERLSRLIANVLQLARMTRNDLQVELQTRNPCELLNDVAAKLTDHVNQAGFTLVVQSEEGAQHTMVSIDADLFAQVVINLVDNAIKFSAKADQKVIDLGVQILAPDCVSFTVRDYGPGIARDQMRDIFKLFYRSENELTRETVGTGIGLALVHQLAQAMAGSVDVVNRDSGAEFQVRFAIVS